jgi:cytochrome P450
MLLDREIPLERRRECVDELRTYLDELITDKRAVPSDDLLGRQIRKQRETGEVDHTGLVGLGMLLLIAGHETTANMISLGTLVLLEHPDQLDLLRTDVERMPDAVEEMLRYFTIAESATARVAVSDVEIAGVVIRTGEGVLGLSGAGNRDPSAFDEPDEFRLTRPGRHHLSFGFGPHQCLGQNLARMELRLTFETLFRRVPTLRLAVRVEDLPFKDGSVVYGVHELPVTW